MKIQGIVASLPEPYIGGKTNSSFYKAMIQDDAPNVGDRLITQIEFDLGRKSPAELGLSVGEKVDVVIHHFTSLMNGIPRVRGELLKRDANPTKAPSAPAGKVA